MAEKKLVVAYCRVSTLEQKKKGYGIEIQIRDVTLFAEQQGVFIDRFFKDEGISGTDSKRKGLNKLLRECKAGAVQLVIIPSLDRLSRNVRIAENLFWEFDRLGVQVLIADMPTYNGQNRQDVLIRQIREAIGEENRKGIIERLLKGRQERVRRGKSPGGNAPYGYQRTTKRLVPNDYEAAIVRAIFSANERQQSNASIAGMLNDRGETRRNGQPWTARLVASILHRRELYEFGLVRYGSARGLNKDLILLEP